MNFDGITNLVDMIKPYCGYDLASLEPLVEAANEVGKAWSGSWLGYHSRVYYKNLTTPPAGANFSQEWGGRDHLIFGKTRGEWHEYIFDDVVRIIYKIADNPSLEQLESDAREAEDIFYQVRASFLSIYHSDLKSHSDDFTVKLVKEIEELKILSQQDCELTYMPKGTLMSRDMQAAEKGIVCPPHISVIAYADALKSPFYRCSELHDKMNFIVQHLERLSKSNIQENYIGKNIFIGHGGSPFGAN